MTAITAFLRNVHLRLDRIGAWLPQLALRALVGWEFLEAGLEKLRGDNWFADVADRFPFPFSLLPTDASWFIATWTEILGGIGLWIGLATRYWALALIVLSYVAIASVHCRKTGRHWPSSGRAMRSLTAASATSSCR